MYPAMVQRPDSVTAPVYTTYDDANCYGELGVSCNLGIYADALTNIIEGLSGITPS